MRIGGRRAPAGVHARRDLCFNRQHLGWPLCAALLRCLRGGKRPTELYKRQHRLSENDFSKISRGDHQRLRSVFGPTEALPGFGIALNEDFTSCRRKHYGSIRAIPRTPRVITIFKIRRVYLKTINARLWFSSR